MKKHFTYRGHKYEYLSHAHNYAWLNERTVEVPIIQKIIDGRDSYGVVKILEIGNVLSNYPGNKESFDILDKYDIDEGSEAKIINADIVNYNPGKKYNLIVSISTMEHVGYDEESYGGTPHTKHSEKISDSLDNMRRNLLKPGGSFVFTVPLGYNRQMDKDIFLGHIKLETVFYMRRISADNRWQECTLDKVIDSEYGAPYQFANAIAICTVFNV